MNCIGQNVSNANFHFYGDDTVIYCSAPTQYQALCQLQLVIDTVQHTFHDLKLILNADKTKLMMLKKIRH